MFNKGEQVIRGHSKREVENKVSNFIDTQDEVKDELWKAEEVKYTPARLANYKPWSCVLRRVE